MVILDYLSSFYKGNSSEIPVSISLVPIYHISKENMKENIEINININGYDF
jgi:hypothetical protein